MTHPTPAPAKFEVSFDGQTVAVFGLVSSRADLALLIRALEAYRELIK